MMNDKVNKIIEIEMAETQSENITPEQKQERAILYYNLAYCRLHSTKDLETWIVEWTDTATCPENRNIPNSFHKPEKRMT